MSEVVTSYLVGQIVDLSLALNGILPPGGTPAWSIDNPALATLAVAEDGATAKLTGIASGVVTVTFTDSPVAVPPLAITFNPVVATSGTITASLDPASPAA